MKNKFFTGFLVLGALFFVSCGNLTGSKNENNDNKNGKVKLNFVQGGSGKSARTVTSAAGYDISALEWTVEFIDNATDESAGSVTVDEDGFETELSPGTYTAKASAEYKDASDNVHQFYGEKEFTIAIGEETEILIKVGLKKTSTGKGSIGEITIDLTKVEDVLSEMEGDLSAKLTPVAGGTDVTLSVSVDGNTATLTTEAEILSGFYYLEVKYPDGTNMSLTDFLVEISDGDETNGSLEAFVTGLVRAYYASTDGTGGGLSASDKIGFADLLTVLKADEDYWNDVTIYMTEDPEWDFTAYALSKAVKIDIIKGDSQYGYFVYKNGANVEVHVYYGALTLNVAGGNVKIEKEALGGIAHINLSNGATFAIADTVTTPITVTFTDETIDDYISTPFAVNSGDLNFTLDAEQNSAYSVVTETSDSSKSYYLVKTGSANISLNSLPAFELTGISSEVMFAAGDIEVTASPVTAGESFGDDILFSWTINGKAVTGTDATITFDPTKLMVPFNLSGVNVITCEASNEAGTLRGTVSVEFGFVGDPGIILWNNTTMEEKILKSNATETVNLMGSFGMQSFNGDSIKAGTASVTSSFLKSNVDSIIDFCFDTKGNIYVIHGNYDNKYLQKYDGITKNCILDKEITDLSDCSCENRKSSAYLNNYVYLLMNGKVYQIGMDGSAVELYISESSISALASDGNDLYAAFTSLGGDEDNDLKIGKVIISDEVISFESECLVIDKIVDEMNSTATYKNGWNNEVIGTSGKYENNFTITDIQVNSNKIYALLVEQDNTTGICRGGLLNLNIDSDTISFAPVKGTEYILGWDTTSYLYTDPIYEEHSITNPLLSTSSQSTNLFYGPRKFIAIKPDELWIADEGIFVFEYSNGGYSYKDRKQTNRVVSVNLNDMSMTSNDVDAMFTCTTDSSCGFKYY